MTGQPRDAQRVTYSETVADLEGFGDSAEDVIGMYGGSITSREDHRIRFHLPRRRGDESAGALSCQVEWAAEDSGQVSIIADGDIEGPRAGRIALLVVGAAGSLAFIFWPFFPAMGPVAAIGLVIAIAVYMLTLRRSPYGLVGNLLQEIVNYHHQRDRENEDGDGE